MLQFNFSFVKTGSNSRVLQISQETNSLKTTFLSLTLEFFCWRQKDHFIEQNIAKRKTISCWVFSWNFKPPFSTSTLQFVQILLNESDENLWIQEVCKVLQDFYSWGLHGNVLEGRKFDKSKHLPQKLLILNWFFHENLRFFNLITAILGRSEELVLKNERTAHEPMVLFRVFHENLRFFEFSKRPELESFEIWMFSSWKRNHRFFWGSKSLGEGTGGYYPYQIPAWHGKKRKTNGSAEIRTRGSLGLEVPVFSGGFVYHYPSLCRVGAFTASGTSEEVMPMEQPLRRRRR